jgi:hypothetical protein
MSERLEQLKRDSTRQLDEQRAKITQQEEQSKEI